MRLAGRTGGRARRSRSPQRVPLLFTPNFAPRADYAAALATRRARSRSTRCIRWRIGAELFAGREIMLRVDLGRRPRPSRQGAAPAARQQVRPAAGSSSPSSSALAARARRAHRRPACASGFGHPRCGALGRGLRATRQPRREASAACACSISAAASACRRAPDEAPLDLAALGAALREVKAAYPQFELWARAGPLSGRRRRRAAGARDADQAQGRACATSAVDAGMNSLIRPALYEACHEIVNLTRLDEAATSCTRSSVRSANPATCSAANRRLPPSARRRRAADRAGRRLRRVMASHYNLRDPAAEIRGAAHERARPIRARRRLSASCAARMPMARRELVYAFDDGPELIERIGFPDAPALPHEHASRRSMRRCDCCI